MDVKEKLRALMNRKVMVHSGKTDCYYIGVITNFINNDIRILLAETNNPNFRLEQPVYISMSFIDSVEAVDDPSVLYNEFLPKEVCND